MGNVTVRSYHANIKVIETGKPFDGYVTQFNSIRSPVCKGLIACCQNYTTVLIYNGCMFKLLFQSCKLILPTLHSESIPNATLCFTVTKSTSFELCPPEVSLGNW